MSELSSCRMAVTWPSRSAREAVIAKVSPAAWEFWNGPENRQSRRLERKGHLLPTKFKLRSNLKQLPLPFLGRGWLKV